MRKLATIQKISNIRPIPGADKIEVADVLGWSVVVGKDEFKVGDLAVYFEIDSFLSASNPAFASFEERFTTWGDKKGMRLRTIKLRKQISQGLLMPVSKFSELSTVAEGDDVSEILNIEKWEALEEQKANSGGLNKAAGGGKFPSFIRKTGQERVQNYINELAKHQFETFEVTIKLDGSSMTVYNVVKGSPYYDEIMQDIEIRQLRRLSKFQRVLYKLKKFFKKGSQPDFVQGVCSRNQEVGINENNNFSNYVRENGVLEKIQSVSGSYAFQGELIAPSIQGNYEQVEGFEYHIYDVFDIDKQEYLKPEDARMLTSFAMLSYVPVQDKSFTLPNGEPREIVDKLLTYAIGDGMNKGVRREGLVAKSNSSDFSFKIISNEYLLSKEKKMK